MFYTLRACSEHAPGTLRARYEHAFSKLSTHSQHTINTLSALYQHAISTSHAIRASLSACYQHATARYDSESLHSALSEPLDTRCHRYVTVSTASVAGATDEFQISIVNTLTIVVLKLV